MRAPQSVPHVAAFRTCNGADISDNPCNNARATDAPACRTEARSIYIYREDTFRGSSSTRVKLDHSSRRFTASARFDAIFLFSRSTNPVNCCGSVAFCRRVTIA